MNTILSFILTCLIIESTPGPNMAYLAMLSASEGRRAGFAAVIGVGLGLLAIGMAAALGVAAVISESPLAYGFLRWCGVIYLLWLAWDGWNTGEEISPGETARSAHNAKFFRRGLVTNLLNPKAAMFYVTVLPGFVQVSSGVISQTMILTAIYVGVATAIHVLIVGLAGTARAFLTDPRRSGIVRRFLSLLLAGVALWFVFETEKGKP